MSRRRDLTDARDALNETALSAIRYRDLIDAVLQGGTRPKLTECEQFSLANGLTSLRGTIKWAEEALANLGVTFTEDTRA